MEPAKKKIRVEDVNEQENVGTGIQYDSVLKSKNNEKDEVLSQGKDEDEAKLSSNKEAEQKVGMNLCLNNVHFQGIIKQRYSDFMVRECDLAGKPVYLTDTVNSEKKVYMDTVTTLPPCPIENEELLEEIDQFANNENEDKTKTMVLDVDDDKEHRKLVHTYIKAKYPNVETGTTMLEDKSRAITLSFKSGRAKNSQRRTDSKKKFCHFVLFKQNKDTMECLSLIASFLRINVKCFAYAGTKDRRATTVQKVSVQNTTWERLANLNKRLRNIVVGNFEYNAKGLSLGDLSGNEFTLVIRDVSDSVKKDVNIACSSLRDNGFINYFGLQRFGTGIVPTHDVGKAVLQSNFEQACNLILQVPDKDDKTNKSKEFEALKTWEETKDAEKAFRKIRNKHCNEGKILDGLRKREKKDYLDGLQALPRNMRLLYLHSFQSFIWNKTVSYRIEKYGTLPVKGDLVLLPDKDKDGFPQAKILTEEDIDSNQYSIEQIVLPLPGFDVAYPENSCFDYMKSLMEENGLDITNMRRPQKDFSLSGSYRNMIVKPKKMSWELIRYDDYTIPLIVTDVEKLTEAPQSQDRKKNRDTNAEESKATEAVVVETKNEETNVEEPKSTETSVVEAKSEEQNAKESKEEETKSQETIIEDSKAAEIKEETNAVKMEIDKMNNETNGERKFGVVDGEFLALKLQMTLPSSCYATTALRELLSSDSSYKAQVELNEKFLEKRK